MVFMYDFGIIPMAQLHLDCWPLSPWRRCMMVASSMGVVALEVVDDGGKERT